MPKRLALIGAREGPWIDISRLVGLHLRVTGLPTGAEVLVKVQPTGDVLIHSNGVHPVPAGESARVSCSVEKHMTVCTFITKVA